MSRKYYRWIQLIKLNRIEVLLARKAQRIIEIYRFKDHIEMVENRQRLGVAHTQEAVRAYLLVGALTHQCGELFT